MDMCFIRHLRLAVQVILLLATNILKIEWEGNAHIIVSNSD